MCSHVTDFHAQEYGAALYCSRMPTLVLVTKSERDASCTTSHSLESVQGGVLELFGVGNGVAELAVFVEAAGEEVVEQAGAHLLELRNHRLRLRNRLVHRVQHCGDAGLFS